MGTSQYYAQQGETYRLLGMSLQTPIDPDAPFQDAINAFDEALQANNKYAWAYAHRGATYRLLGCRANSPPQKEENYSKAQEDFEQAIKLNPKYAWAYAQQGENYCCWGVDIIFSDRNQAETNLKAAIKAFDEAIRIDETYAWAYAHRGVVYRFLGGFLSDDFKSKEQPNFDKAVSDLKTAIKLNLKYAWAYAYLATVHREKAQAYSHVEEEQKEKEEWRLAFESVQQAIRLFPGIFDRPTLRKNFPIFPPRDAFIKLDSDAAIKVDSTDKYDLYAKAVSKIYSEGLEAAQKEIEEALAALRSD